MKKEEIIEFNKVLKKTTDKLTKTVSGLEEKIARIVRVNLKKIVAMERKNDRVLIKLTDKVADFAVDEGVIKEALLNQMKAFSGIEETVFILYHSIKKNQFLYAHDDDEWWRKYSKGRLMETE